MLNFAQFSMGLAMHSIHHFIYKIIYLDHKTDFTYTIISQNYVLCTLKILMVHLFN